MDSGSGQRSELSLRDRNAGRHGNFLHRLSGFFLSYQRGSASAAAGRVQRLPLPSGGRINPSGRRSRGEEGGEEVFLNLGKIFSTALRSLMMELEGTPPSTP